MHLTGLLLIKPRRGLFHIFAISTVKYTYSYSLNNCKCSMAAGWHLTRVLPEISKMKNWKNEKTGASMTVTSFFPFQLLMHGKSSELADDKQHGQPIINIFCRNVNISRKEVWAWARIIWRKWSSEQHMEWLHMVWTHKISICWHHLEWMIKCYMFLLCCINRKQQPMAD